MARLRRLGATVRCCCARRGRPPTPDSPTTTPEQLAARPAAGIRRRPDTPFLPDRPGTGVAVPRPARRSARRAPGGDPRRAAARHRATWRPIGRAAGGGSARGALPARRPHGPRRLGSAAAEAQRRGRPRPARIPHLVLAVGGRRAATRPPGGPHLAAACRLVAPLRPAGEAKAAAMAAHASQVRPLSGLPGDEVLLPPAFLEHFERPWETFAWHPAVPRPPPRRRPCGRPGVAGDGGSRRPSPPPTRKACLTPSTPGSDDPWQYTTSWYEHRKRTLTLAALPGMNYTAGLEIGCSIGTLSVELAQRCGSFLAVDASSAALAHAATAPRAPARGADPPPHRPAGLAGRPVRPDRGLRGGLLPLTRQSWPGCSTGSRPHSCPAAPWPCATGGTPSPAGSSTATPSTPRPAATSAGPAPGLYRERDFVLEVLLAPDAVTACRQPPGGPERIADDRR